MAVNLLYMKAVRSWKKKEMREEGLAGDILIFGICIYFHATCDKKCVNVLGLLSSRPGYGTVIEWVELFRHGAHAADVWQIFLLKPKPKKLQWRKAPQLENHHLCKSLEGRKNCTGDGRLYTRWWKQKICKRTVVIKLTTVAWHHSSLFWLLISVFCCGGLSKEEC